MGPITRYDSPLLMGHTAKAVGHVMTNVAWRDLIWFRPAEKHIERLKLGTGVFASLAMQSLSRDFGEDWSFASIGTIVEKSGTERAPRSNRVRNTMAGPIDL